MNTPVVTVVVPVHNEQENVSVLTARLQQIFTPLAYEYNVIFVDDGSTDKTVEVLKQLSAADNRIGYLSFSRNFGHQAALKAGLDHANGDCVISMDGDMQHPPALIPAFLEKWREGYDVVYTLREEDPQLDYFKKASSRLFYKTMNRLSEIEMEKGSADFRLLDRKVVDILRNLPENELFFRGLVKWAGFSQYAMEYTPDKRYSGESKYNLKKMMRLALQGITSFSIKPLYLAIYLGLTISLLAVLYVPYALYGHYMGHARPGWASIIVTIAFFGGMQLMILGIIGLYLGKLFMQSKNRPVYLIRESKLS